MTENKNEKDTERETQQEELDNAKKENMQLDNISQSGGITTRTPDMVLHSIIIAGQIEGHTSLGAPIKSTKYEHIIPQLVYIEENPEIDGLLLLLNTVGGDVEAGLAIAEMISGMKKPVVSLVLGGGHSIGIPLAVSAKRSFIVKSATMTVHPVRVNGLVIGVPQSFEYLKRMQDRICDFITENSKIDRKKLDRLMYQTSDMTTDIGSIVDGEQAVKLGLIDSLGGLSDAILALKEMKNTVN